MQSSQDYYETLGVPRDASAEEIRESYNRLAQAHQAGLMHGETGAEEHFRTVQDAYEVLSDTDRREKYDRATFRPQDVESASALATSPRERYPFWGYVDVLAFIGLVLPCLFLAELAAGAFQRVIRLRVHSIAMQVLPGQSLFYALLFSALYLLLKLRYDRPFWESLRWVRTRIGVPRTILYGFVLAFGIALLGSALHTPDLPTPMKQLLSDRSSIVLIAIFAITVGPICEELAFRGFLQPVLVRSLGPIAGILLTAVLFGLLHLPEYGRSWRHGLLITVAGIAFGCMRHLSGSTRAAAIMHAAYNFIFFATLFSQKGNLPTSW